jgi:DNA-binding MarR family transcriptional regulator
MKQREPLTRLHNAIRLCLAKHPGLTLSQLDVLLTIALTPGRQQSDIAEAVGLSSSAVSRNLRMLSKGRKDTVNRTSLKLIRTERDNDDERIMQVYLSDNGEQFIQLLSDLLQ